MTDNYNIEEMEISHLGVVLKAYHFSRDDTVNIELDDRYSMLEIDLSFKQARELAQFLLKQTESK